MPDFVNLAAAAEHRSSFSEQPPPLEKVSTEAAHLAFFPDGEPDALTPLGAAYIWWTALLDRNKFQDVLQALTHHQPAWGDYESAVAMLSGAAIMQFVERCPGDDHIAYVKFMPNVNEPMRAFGEFHLIRPLILTMIRYPDGYWRAWGLTEDYFPTSAEVRREIL